MRQTATALFDDPLSASWLVTPRRSGEARATLVVFPYAGLGGSLAAHLSRELDLPVAVHGIQLPGHEARLSEPPLTRMAAVIDAALPTLARLTREPCILMGCSLGALIAYELALRLAALGTPPDHLVLLSCAAPHLPRTSRALSALPDAEFLAAIDDRFGGVPDAVKRSAELRQLLLPTLRADMALFDAYRWSAPPPLDVPILTIAGRDDRQISPAEMLPWEELTTARTEHRVVDGGHFVLRDDPAAVAAVLHAAFRGLAA